MINFNTVEQHVREAMRVARFNETLKCDSFFQADNIGYIIKGCITGGIIGLLVSIFRLGLDYSLDGLLVIYPYLKANPMMLLPYILATIVVWLVLVQVIRPLYRDKEITWFSSLWRNGIGALLAIAPGIFAGREGPAIKIGLYSAKGLAKNVFKEKEDNRFLLINSGMSAGLGAAFSSPISGTLFLIEAVNVPFSPLMLFTSISASITAVCVTYLFFGVTPCLYMPAEGIIPLSSYWILLILGIFVGIITRLFHITLIWMKEQYKKLPIPTEMNILIPMLLVIPIGLIYPKILGGSHHFIHELMGKNFMEFALSGNGMTAMAILAIMLITRFVFTGISCGASAPTGIFMPILAMGAAFGALFATGAIHMGLIEPACYMNIVICSMAAYFGAALKTPLTAVILIVETIGSIEIVMPVVIVTWLAAIVNHTLRGTSIYGGE